MTKETKIKLLQVILNAGIKGTDREMLDNLKAVIRAIENDNVALVSKEALIKTVELEVEQPSGSTSFKRKPGRPFKKR